MPPTNKLIRAKGLMEPISHYSDAVVAGKTIYVSGCASTDEHGQLVGRGDITAQTRKTLDNMKIALAAALIGAVVGFLVRGESNTNPCLDRLD